MMESKSCHIQEREIIFQHPCFRVPAMNILERSQQTTTTGFPWNGLPLSHGFCVLISGNHQVIRNLGWSLVLSSPICRAWNRSFSGSLLLPGDGSRDGFSDDEGVWIGHGWFIYVPVACFMRSISIPEVNLGGLVCTSDVLSTQSKFFTTRLLDLHNSYMAIGQNVVFGLCLGWFPYRLVYLMVVGWRFIDPRPYCVAWMMTHEFRESRDASWLQFWFEFWLFCAYYIVLGFPF